MRHSSWFARSEPTDCSTFKISYALLRVQLDDKLLVHRRRLHVFAASHRHDTRFEIFAVNIEPRSHALAIRQVAGFEHHGVLVHLFLERDILAHLDQIAWDVDFVSLDANVAVQYELA